MSQMKPVESSLINAVGYDHENEELTIAFKTNGQKYLYKGVPASLYSGLLNAHSVGQYFLRNIKPHYSGVKQP